MRVAGVRALVGGYDVAPAGFDRATQGLRQPGSTFKPFVYTAAIDNGWSPNYQLLDGPLRRGAVQDSGIAR